MRTLCFVSSVSENKCRRWNSIRSFIVCTSEVGTCGNGRGIEVLRYYRIQIFLPQYKIPHFFKFYLNFNGIQKSFEGLSKHFY